jgi:hypothetical protein
MSSIVLGKTDAGHTLKLDVDLLLRTRLLIQGGSGSGKSWLLRRLAEQLFGKVPVIIIDPEGEFATLREQYGYVLVGKGGETPADPRSAPLLAEKLLELHASAICDLYELKPAQRHAWVKAFLEALIDAPKKLWQPAIIIVDEAHLFAPEKGAGESEASEAMIALTSRGRKRGFCAVFATQRLGKLRKDAAAELLNVLIGNTFIDIDRQRAAESLGVANDQKKAFFDQVKVLTEGQFWALGRALTVDRTLVTIGPVTTSHPKAGFSKHGGEPPPAPDKVRALLPKLADLPAEAEAKQQTIAELKRGNIEKDRRIRELERASADSSHSTECANPAEKRGAVLTDADRALLEKVAARLGEQSELLRHKWAEAIEEGKRATTEACLRAWAEVIASRSGLTGELEKQLDAKGFQKILAKLGAAAAVSQNCDIRPSNAARTPSRAPSLRPNAPARLQLPPRADGPGDDSLGSGERTTLIAIAQAGDRGATREQLTVSTGYKRSTRNTYLQRLAQRTLIQAKGDNLIITAAGLTALGSDYEPLPIGDALREHWLQELPEGERKLLDLLAAAYPMALDRETLSAQSGYTRSSRNTYLQRLSARQLITNQGGSVRAAEELFD